MLWPPEASATGNLKKLVSGAPTTTAPRVGPKLSAENADQIVRATFGGAVCDSCWYEALLVTA